MSAHALAAAIGMLAGAHTATWGMYKDSIHEGFCPWKYLRSIVLAMVIAVAIHRLVDTAPGTLAGAVLLFGLVYVIERAAVELYKTFLREEDQSKYHIPMQLHVLGSIVRSRVARAISGVAFVGLLFLIVRGAVALEQAALSLPAAASALLFGALAGLVSATMGAWKDAPIEGFELGKFMRSPAIAAGYALLLAPLTTSDVQLAAASLGFTIATIETYKTFFTRGRPPGKFAGKPIHFPEMLRLRERVVPLYVAICAAMVLTGIAAIVESRADAKRLQAESPEPSRPPIRGTSAEITPRRRGS